MNKLKFLEVKPLLIEGVKKEQVDDNKSLQEEGWSEEDIKCNWESYQELINRLEGAENIEDLCSAWAYDTEDPEESLVQLICLIVENS